MAAQTSSNRIHNYSKVLAKNCYRQSALIIVLLGLSVAFGVIQFVALGNNLLSRDFYQNSFLFSLTAALAGVLIVPALFREVYNRQFADVEFSLPMSASERFRAKLSVILKKHIIPFIIAQLIILLIAVITTTWDFSCQVVLPNCLRSINFALFTDAVCLLCVSCCGHIVECLYTPVLLILSFSVFIPLILVKFLRDIARIGSTFWEEVINLGVGFPKLAMAFLEDMVDGRGELVNDVGDDFPTAEKVMLFVNLVFCVLLVFIAFRIYKKRNGLSVGKSFVSPGFYRFFLIFVTLNVILLFFLNSLYLAVLIGLISCFAISISSKRKKVSLKDIEFALLSYCGTLVFVLAVGFVSYLTGAFGLAYSRPGEEFTGENSGLFVSIKGENGQSYYFDFAARSALAQAKPEFAETAVYADRDKIDIIFDEAHASDIRKHSSFADNLSNYSALLRYEKDFVYGDNRDWTIYISCSQVEFDGYYDVSSDSYNQTIMSSKEECLRFMKAVEDKCGMKFEFQEPVEYYDYSPEEVRTDTVSPDESGTEASETAK